MPSTQTSSSKSRSTSRSSSSSRQPQAIKLLMDDHRMVEKLYKQFEKLSEKDSEEKDQIIQTVCAALSAHARLEEELFYPAVRDEIKESDLIDEAEVEHQSTKDLIAKLQSGDLDDEKRDATFTVLCEYVMHHVEEEEKELFPQVKKAKGVDLDALADEMVARKSELEQEMGLMADSDDDEDEADDDEAVSSKSSSKSGSSASRKSS